MNRIITRPEEIVKNERVLYAGNHYLSVPIIDCQNGAIKNINVVSLSNKALVELKGETNLFTPHFYKEGKEIEISLFFNHFYSIDKDMESDKYMALTSRSPRYYVSGAFWERYQ
jgi:hypothetical protein